MIPLSRSFGAQNNYAERKKADKKKAYIGTSLAVQWLGLRASTARDTGSIPSRGTKIPHATWHGQKKKKKGVYAL